MLHPENSSWVSLPGWCVINHVEWCVINRVQWCVILLSVGYPCTVSDDVFATLTPVMKHVFVQVTLKQRRKDDSSENQADANTILSSFESNELNVVHKSNDPIFDQHASSRASSKPFKSRCASLRGAKHDGGKQSASAGVSRLSVSKDENCDSARDTTRDTGNRGGGDTVAKMSRQRKKCVKIGMAADLGKLPTVK